MTSTTIQPNSTAYSNYTFDSSSAGNYSLVNVNVNYDNNEVLICDKIKLVSSGSPSTIYNISHFAQLLIDWLKSIVDPFSVVDLNEDGIVNTRDLGIMMSNWEN